VFCCHMCTFLLYCYCDILGFHSNVTGLCNNENKRFHDALNNETDETMKQM
jgi:hypothetical protein